MAARHRRRELRRQSWHRASGWAGSRSRRWTAAPGDATDGLGGGNGFAVGSDAPPETVDFLHFLVSEDAANRWGALNTRHPADDRRHGVVGHRSAAASTCWQARAKAQFVQLYLDQATTPDLGAAINEAVATLYAGSGTPESVAEAINEFAQQ